MKYLRALAERRRALAACHAARGQLHDSVDEVVGAYQAHPLPALAGAAVVGFVLAQLRLGNGVIRAGAQVASGPAWRLVRQYLQF